jgi:hypothetical protein
VVLLSKGWGSEGRSGPNTAMDVCVVEYCTAGRSQTKSVLLGTVQQVPALRYHSKEVCDLRYSTAGTSLRKSEFQGTVQLPVV